MFRYILFDFDGTVFDTVEGITKSVRYAINLRGMDAELDSLRCFAGPPLVDMFMEHFGFTQEEAEQILQSAARDAKMTYLASTVRFVPSQRGALHTPVKLAAYLWVRLLGSRHFIRRLEERSRRHDYETSTYVGCTSWDLDFLYIYRREDLEELIDVPFENGVFPIPAAYDRVLRHSYGDYMQLPPEEDRVGHHYYKAYLREETKEEESR